MSRVYLSLGKNECPEKIHEIEQILKARGCFSYIAEDENNYAQLAGAENLVIITKKDKFNISGRQLTDNQLRSIDYALSNNIHVYLCYRNTSGDRNFYSTVVNHYRGVIDNIEGIAGTTDEIGEFDFDYEMEEYDEPILHEIDAFADDWGPTVPKVKKKEELNDDSIYGSVGPGILLLM